MAYTGPQLLLVGTAKSMILNALSKSPDTQARDFVLGAYRPGNIEETWQAIDVAHAKAIRSSAER